MRDNLRRDINYWKARVEFWEAQVERLTRAHEVLPDYDPYLVQLELSRSHLTECVERALRESTR